MTQTTIQKSATLKVREYAERERVSERTVRNWIKKGALKVQRLGPRLIRIVE
jgi:excisionase family DNA binding protein